MTDIFIHTFVFEISIFIFKPLNGKKKSFCLFYYFFIYIFNEFFLLLEIESYILCFDEFNAQIFNFSENRFCF